MKMPGNFFFYRYALKDIFIVLGYPPEGKQIPVASKKHCKTGGFSNLLFSILKSLIIVWPIINFIFVTTQTGISNCRWYMQK